MYDIWSNLLYWLNSNILSFSDGIIIQQESLFIHTFFMRFKFIFVLKNGRTYLSFFNIYNIESNCRIIFVKYFSIFDFWWIIDSFPLTTDKRFNIWNSFKTPLSFCEIECNRYLVLKKVIFFFEFIVASLFFIFQKNLYMIDDF